MRWWRCEEREADLERELRSHLELEAEEELENGHRKPSMPPAAHSATQVW